MEIKHDKSKIKNRFQLLDNDKVVGEINYAYVKDLIIDINHTEVDNAYRGQNLGQKLIEAVADYARKNKLKVTASCPYVGKVFEKTNHYDDIKV